MGGARIRKGAQGSLAQQRLASTGKPGFARCGLGCSGNSRAPAAVPANSPGDPLLRCDFAATPSTRASDRGVFANGFGLGGTPAAPVPESAPAPARYNRLRRPRHGPGESGGIGIRAGFRCQWGNPWGFESPLSHHCRRPSRRTRGRDGGVTSFPWLEREPVRERAVRAGGGGSAGVKSPAGGHSFADSRVHCG